MKRAACGLLMIALLSGVAGCQPSTTEIRDTATAEFNVGHNARAKELFHRVIAREPQDAQAAYHLGRIYHSEKDYVKALHWYQAALRSEPGFEAPKVGMRAIQREDPRLYKLLVMLPVQNGDQLP